MKKVVVGILRQLFPISTIFKDYCDTKSTRHSYEDPSKKTDVEDQRLSMWRTGDEEHGRDQGERYKENAYTCRNRFASNFHAMALMDFKGVYLW